MAGGFAVRAAMDGDGGDGLPPDPPVRVLPSSAPDPFAYSEARREEFERRAAAGLSHVLYVKSPGGIVASARRTARYRPLIERIARRSSLDPDLIEAIVLLESAGRPDAAADPELEGAVGLTQILASTGQGLLAMRVDTERSRVLTAKIARARFRGRPRRVRRLEAARRRADQRFDPREALEATARYLTFARRQLRREDLAIVSYHMGVGNLTQVIADFGEGASPSYVRLYFDSAPNRHAAAYRRLASLGDDSSTYFWRVLAARGIMREYRRDPEALSRTAALHTSKASAEEVLHPPGSTEVFADPEALEDAYRAGELRPFPAEPERTGLRRARQMGDLARRLEARATPLPRAAPGGVRARAVHDEAGAPRGGRHEAARGDQHRARPDLPGPADRVQPRGHDRVLAAHHGVRVRPLSPLLGQAPGRGGAVRPRPPRGAQPHRLGARSRPPSTSPSPRDAGALTPLLEDATQ